VFVPAPVGRGCVQERKGVPLDHACVLHVRPPAEIREAVMRVGRDRLALGQLLKQLQLVRLVSEQAAGLLPGDFPAHERMPRLDALDHEVRDLAQVVFGQRTGQLKVVVEAILDGWANAQFRTWEEFQHRLRHDVGGRVPQFLEFFGFHEIPSSGCVPGASGLPAEPRMAITANRGSTLLLRTLRSRCWQGSPPARQKRPLALGREVLTHAVPPTFRHPPERGRSSRR